LKANIERGTVVKYAETIIKGFRDQSKGGAVYREVA